MNSICIYMNSNNNKINQLFLATWTLLHIAVLLNNKVLVSLFLSQSQTDVTVVDAYSYTALSFAAEIGSDDIVALLLQKT